MSKKEKINSEEKIMKEVQKLFNKYNISGIIKIHDMDIVSNFRSHGDKLEIFDFIDTEKKITEQLLNKEIFTSVNLELNSKFEKNKYAPTYIG